MENWKEFEALVAAIHHASSQGADVHWNEIIDGRQFDVTVRFHIGVHEYLTVIECKRYSSDVPVSDIEAFATKSRGVKANKAIVVSATGYQSGAIDVAEREDIVLLTVSESYEDYVPVPADAEPLPALNIDDIRIFFEDDESIALGSNAKLEYMAKQSIIHDAFGAQMTVSELVEIEAQGYCQNGKTEERVAISLPDDCVFIGADGTKKNQPTSIEFNLKVMDNVVSAKSGPTWDFNLIQNLAHKYQLRTLDGTILFDSFLNDLSLGQWSEVETGRYYTNPAFGFYYLCENIVGDFITWLVIESYQHGHLVQARFKQKKKHSGQYLLVTDKKKISELEALHKQLQDSELREK